MILDALCKLENNEIPIKLNVVGDYLGSYSSDYREYIGNQVNNLPENIVVQFHGWVTDTSYYYNISDVFLFSSVLDGTMSLGNECIRLRSSEALPTVLIESLAYGVPAIATNAPGVSEIITDVTEGVII
ncbi:glycosyltransferase, partial [Vibrio alginolyticus]|nr:glycosyltransferase family 4 protein [Vibrio alginolyticus]